MEAAARHVIVTGGSRGIGAALVRGLLTDGYLVSTCSRAPSDAVELLRADPRFGPRLHFGVCEVGEADQVDAFVRQAVGWAGGVYGLVNNAGVARAGILASFPNVESERILKANLLGPIQMSRAVAAHLVKNRDGGRIVNVSSIIGSRGYNGLAAYSASKAGLDGLTRSLARELGRRRITVNGVAPGYVDTDMARTLTPEQVDQIVRRTPLGRLASTEDVLALVRFLLSDAASMITGQTIFVDGGVSV